MSGHIIGTGGNFWEFEHLFELIGMPITPQDHANVGFGDRVVYCGLGTNQVYLNLAQVPKLKSGPFVPLKMTEFEYEMLWWSYRLSQMSCLWSEYLAEILLPKMRRFFSNPDSLRSDDEQD